MENADQFLATVIEAAVAIVAIVGGLLVSRIVSLATERSGLQQRRDDLRIRRGKAQDRYDELEARLLRLDAQEVLEPHVNALARLEAGTEVDLPAMIREAEIERTAAQLRPFLDDLLSELAVARENLLPLFRKGRPALTLDDILEQGLVEVTGSQDLNVYEAVFAALWEEHAPPPDPYGLHSFPGVAPFFDPNAGTVSAIHHQVEQAVHLQISRDRDEALYQVTSLEAQLAQADEALARVSRPDGVTPALLVLALFSFIAATALVLIVTTNRLDAWAAWSLVALFVSGLVGLLGYLLVVVTRAPS